MFASCTRSFLRVIMQIAKREKSLGITSLISNASISFKRIRISVHRLFQMRREILI